MRIYLILFFKFSKSNSMKNSMYFVVICATLLFTCCKKSIEAASCLPANLNNGVIAFYPFSNGSLNDVLNNHNLSNTTTAKPSSDRSGNSNCAFEFKNFPSGLEFLTHQNPIFLNNLTLFSLSLWYQPLDTNRLGGSYEGLISRDTSTQSGDKYGQWSVGLYDCRRAVFGINCGVLWDNFNLQQSTNDCSDRFFYTNKWHHLVVTYNNDSLTLFRNGVPSTRVYRDSSSCRSISQDIGNLFIGKGFTGRIDDIAIFNRVLTATEVSQLQNLPACCE
jgi:Concanavalin A-like lectin/glucanases superfamily